MEFRYKYTDTELKQLLSQVIILVDTREQENDHIIKYFDDKKITYKNMKLDFADYSFMLPSQPDLGIMRDMYFTDDIAIERKGSLEELSNNFTKDRSRIESEFLRAKGKIYLLIEDGNGYENIINHRYSTQFKPKAYIATLKTFENRYNLNINFIKKECAGNFIYYTFLYYLRCSLID